MSLIDALKALSDAHGPKALAHAFAHVQGQVRGARRAAKQQWGQLAETFGIAMRLWDEQKAAGVPREGRIAGLEQSLRAAWPQTREWKYLCGGCDDTGLRLHECPGDKPFCGRRKAHLPHEYGEPCSCAAGLKYQPQPEAAPQDFRQAGKAKPQGFSRMGR